MKSLVLILLVFTILFLIEQASLLFFRITLQKLFVIITSFFIFLIFCALLREVSSFRF